MSLANNEILKKFRHLHSAAIDLKEKFDVKASIDVLNILQEQYGRELKHLTQMVPNEVLSKGSLLRHSIFLNKYLVEEKPEYCYDDIRSICIEDIFEAEENYLQHLAEKGSKKTSELNWSIIHPLIHKLAKPRFEQGLYSDAIVTAFKEINSQVKMEYKALTGNELDGASLMRHAFSTSNKNRNNPTIKLNTNKTDSEINKQDGYMNIFAGVMMGIRNPYSHANLELNMIEAWEMLIISSHLMRIWDERVKPQ